MRCRLCGLGLIILLTTGVTTTGGAWAQSDVDSPQPAPTEPAPLTLDELRAFIDAFNQVRHNYVEPVDESALLDAALRGMLSDLDPHSEYLPPQAYQNVNESVRGEYGGVGIIIDYRESEVIITEVMPGGPAGQAGLQPGDRIVSVDGTAVSEQRPRRAIPLLRGSPGTSVEVSLERDGELFSRNITRDVIRAPSVIDQSLGNGFVHVRITAFQRGTERQLQEALTRRMNTGELKGVVLDLRGNPGGTLNAGVSIADDFLDEGMIVTTRGRGDEIQLEFTATPGDLLQGAPMVILVDSATASASEIVAGALQDNNRAIVVGEQTFGKGSVQSVLPLRSGGAVKLTTARYFTPSGRSIQLKGIQPDVRLPAVRVVDTPTRVREQDLERRLDNQQDQGETDTEVVSPAEDYALYEALNLLKGASLLSERTHRPD